MTNPAARIEALIASELDRITELSTSLGAVLTASTRSGFVRIIAAIDAAAGADPEHAAEFAALREAAIVMRDFNPFRIANDNG
jgi:hypothetical protein